MRAEEGDETVRDYAVEGEQALNKIKETQRSSANPLARVGRWVLDRLPGGSRT